MFREGFQIEGLSLDMNDAQLSVLSLLLEVSANPKPGNVDREHDFENLKYEHFLISAVSSYPIFEDCMNKRGSIGLNILRAVSISYKICKTNVHFGAFMLLIPLVWCKGNVKEVKDELKKTTYKDSLAVLSAFKLCKPRVMDVKELNLKDEDIEGRIVEEDVNLYEWLEKSPEENIVARELVEGYWRCLKGARILKSYFELSKSLNDAIVYTYLNLLSSYIDPLILAKHGVDVARRVKEQASEVLSDFEEGRFDTVKKFDIYLLSNGINPGSIADLTAVSIYLALKEGLL